MVVHGGVGWVGLSIKRLVGIKHSGVHLDFERLSKQESALRRGD